MLVVAVVCHELALLMNLVRNSIRVRKIFGKGYQYKSFSYFLKKTLTRSRNIGLSFN